MLHYWSFNISKLLLFLILKQTSLHIKPELYIVSMDDTQKWANQVNGLNRQYKNPFQTIFTY